MKRKIESFMFCVFAFILFVGLSGCGDKGQDSIEYKKSDDGNSYIVTQFKEDNIIVPETYKGLPVTGIELVEGNTSFHTVQLPNSITKISQDCFKNNCNLKSIRFGNGLKELPAGVFAYCHYLETIDLPDSLEVIGADCFISCGFSSITLPSNLKKIDKSAFAESCLSTLTFPNGLKEIGEYAFYRTKLTSVTLPNSVETLGDGAFSDCYDLTDITLSSGLKEINRNVFYYCDNLENIALPEGIEKIGTSAFEYCKKLSTIAFPSSLKYVDEDAFSNANSVSDVTIPGGIATWCGIEFSKYSNPFYNRGIFSINGEKIEDLVIPDTVAEIKAYAFCGVGVLNSITIPSSITKIGESAFSSINDVCIYNEDGDIIGWDYQEYDVYIKDFKAWCSVDCADKYGNPICYASKIYFDNTLFHDSCDSKFLDIEIPSDVRKVGSYVFAIESTNFKKIYVSKEVEEIGKGAFSANPGAVFYLPFIGASRTINENSYFGYILDMEGEGPIDTLGSGYIVIYDTKDIPSNAFNFYYEPSIKVKGTGEVKAYEEEFDLAHRHGVNKQLIIDESVETIGLGAFKIDGELVDLDVTLPFLGASRDDQTNNYFGYIFGVKNVASNADDTSSVDSVTLTSGKVISDFAFSGCTSISKIILLDNVTSIGNSAFKGCSRLSSITFNGTMEEWNALYSASLSIKTGVIVTCSDGTITIE